MAVLCIATARAAERQCAEVEGTDVGLDSTVEADTEVAVAAAQDHYFAFGLDNNHSYWREDSRSIADDPRERTFSPLRTIFEPPRRIESPWLVYVQQAAG